MSPHASGVPMLGLILLYVGAVLFINALTALGHIEPKEAAIMNL
ncbi:MAG: AmiS/UreI family transporter, partial [Rhodoferax sp.]